MADNKQIQSLLKLIDDPDEYVFTAVENKLISMGVDIIPFLEEEWTKNDRTKLFRDRVEDIIHKIYFNLQKQDLTDWVSSKDKNLLKASWIIARYKYPQLKFDYIYDKILRIKENIGFELQNNYTPLEQIRTINFILYGINRFSVNTTDFYNIDNFYINKVFENKKSSHIILSVIYLTLADFFKLPIVAVNIPGNLILAYLDTSAPNNIFFYINPAMRGEVISTREVGNTIERLKKGFPKQNIRPPTIVDNIQLINILFDYLIFSYEKIQLDTGELKILKSILPE